MTGRLPRELVLCLTVALALAGCGILPFDPLDPDARRWIIPVDNQSDRPAIVAVAMDEASMGDLVGRADPNTIPPRTRLDVAFTVPATGLDWAIFVNPGPNRGPLILARDVPPGRAGRLPIKIGVGADGQPFVEVPSEPGWFGN
jgi:hypothetical protein